MVLNAIAVLVFAVPLAGVLPLPPLPQAEQPKPPHAFRYAALSIDHRGPSIQENNLVLKAQEGLEFVDVEVRVTPLVKVDIWTFKAPELETVDGVTAKCAFSEGSSRFPAPKDSPWTVKLRFVAPIGATFKTLRLNGESIDVTRVGPSKPEPEPPKK